MVGETLRHSSRSRRVREPRMRGAPRRSRRKFAVWSTRRIRTPQARGLSAQSHLYARRAVLSSTSAPSCRAPILGEILDGELFAGEELFADARRARSGGVLDLCTGSGCLAILAAMRFPEGEGRCRRSFEGRARRSPKRMSREHRLQSRVRLLHGDLFAPLKGRRYDLIVSNPPYVDAKGMRGLPPECRHEPATGVRRRHGRASRSCGGSSTRPARISPRAAACCARSAAAGARWSAPIRA